jgi:kinesin family member C2/C3
MISQVLKGNIRVMCRVRPAQPTHKSVISYPLEGLLTISPGDRRPQEFEFDHVFGPQSTQVGTLSLESCSMLC